MTNETNQFRPLTPSKSEWFMEYAFEAQCPEDEEGDSTEITVIAAQNVEKIVAEATKRGEVKALESVKWDGMFPKAMPKSMQDGYMVAGLNFNATIQRLLTSLEKI